MLVISTIKAALAMYCTYLYSKFIYVILGLVLLWHFYLLCRALLSLYCLLPFFSDVFIWMPLLLFSIERTLQKQKFGLFIVTITLIMINNFYFAYYLCLIGGLHTSSNNF